MINKIQNNKKSAFIVAVVVLLTSVLSLNLFYTNAGSSGTSYNVYNAKTGTLRRAYTLYVGEAYNSNSAETNSGGVIGNDDRDIDWSKSGVVKINSSSSTQSYTGTGFVVDAHTIATAAHCLISENATQAHIINKVTLYDNKGNVAMEATPVELHVPIKYANRTYDQTVNKYYSKDDDYGLITIKEDLSAYACFNLGTPLEDFPDYSYSQNIYAFITGFPSKVDGENAGGLKYTSYGKINEVDSNDIWFDIDATPGTSGAPVYIEERAGGKTYYTVIGIYVGYSSEDGGDNAGKRMTAELIKFYKGNDQLIYW